jgi:hypothetical protein
MTMGELLEAKGGLSDHDLATLADWAGAMNRSALDPSWKRAYALIREGCDLLLRRRAKSTCAIEDATGYTGKCTDNLRMLSRV